MAKINIMNLSGHEYRQVNLTSPIGAGERNERNDVMLIQALFQILAVSEHSTKRHFRLDRGQLPQPTGVCDRTTQRAIWAFQKTNFHRLLAVDGKIHPANYRNRVINNPLGRVMAITFLNFKALEMVILSNSGSLEAYVKKIAPSIVFTELEFGDGLMDFPERQN